MAYSISVDTTAIVDGAQIDAADVTTPIGNLKTAVQDLGNGVSAPETFRMAQIATPSPPAASSNSLYFKSGDIPYFQTSGGVEKMVGAVQLNTPRTVLSGTAASVTISSIPSTFKHLLLIVEARTDVAATADSLILRFNADATAGNYYTDYFSVLGATITGAEVLGSGVTGILLPLAAPGNTGVAGNGYALVWIFNYTSTTMRRIVDAKCGCLAATSSGNVKKADASGWWTNTSAAISSLTFLPSAGTNLAINSAYTLYGFN